MKQNRIARIRHGLALLLALSMTAQTALTGLAAAAPEAESVVAEAVETEVPEAAPAVPVTLPEEIISATPAQADDMRRIGLQYGKAINEEGLTWDGQGHLNLNHYQQEVAIFIYLYDENVNRTTTVTVTGNCMVGLIGTTATNDNATHSLTITGSGTLRFRQKGRISEASSMIQTRNGNILIDGMTLDMESTVSEAGYGIVVSGGTITINNSKINMRMDGFYGIYSYSQADHITLKDTVLMVHGKNADRVAHVVRSAADLTMSNVTIRATGNIATVINVENNLNADALTLEAQLTSVKPYNTTAIYCKESAEIRDSHILAEVAELVSYSRGLTMVNTDVNASIYCSQSKSREDMFFEGRGFTSVGQMMLQGCDITMNMNNPAGAGEKKSAQGISVSYGSLTLADTALRIRGSSGPEEFGIMVNQGNLICKGNTDVDIVTSGYAFNTGDDGNNDSIRLQDALAVLTPASWNIGEYTVNMGQFWYSYVTLLDADEKPARVLKIGKGSGPSGSTGSGSSGSTGSGSSNSGDTSGSGSGGAVSSGSGASTGSGNASGSGGASGGGSSSGNTSAAGTWKRAKNGKYWYDLGKGRYPKSKWLQVDGKWYYFDKSGYMVSGWKKINKKWYYFGGKKDGAMKTGWKKIGGKWYYLTPKTGAMVTGWKKISGKWYYMDKKSGAMKTGWLKSGGKWYYLDGKGRMLVNTSRKIGKKTYSFNKSGVCMDS